MTDGLLINLGVTPRQSPRKASKSGASRISNSAHSIAWGNPRAIQGANTHEMTVPTLPGSTTEETLGPDYRISP